jgi:hypothetical protein
MAKKNHIDALRKPELIPFSEVANNFSPEELEHLYPGITAPGGYLRYVSSNPVGQAFIKRPEILEPEGGTKPEAVVKIAAATPRKLSRDEIMKMYQDTIKGSPLKNTPATKGLPALSVTIGRPATADKIKVMQAAPDAVAVPAPNIDTAPVKDVFASHDNIRDHDALRDPQIALALADYAAARRPKR